MAAEGARFGVNGVNIGLFCSTPMVALTRNIGRKAAFEMLTTGEFVEADEARAARARQPGRGARGAGGRDPGAGGDDRGKLGPVVRIGKRAFYEQAELGLEAAYALTGAVMVENMLRPDTAEGVDAFLDKRPPAWRR